MKRAIVCAALLAALLSGCAGGTYKPQLPEPHAAFAMRDWQSGTVEEDNCGAFVYAGRQYLYYADLSRALTERDVAGCLGCVSRDGTERTDELVLSLSADPAHNYLVIYFDVPGPMPPPHAVYRAADTRSREITAPSPVASPVEGTPMYRYWTEGASDPGV